MRRVVWDADGQPWSVEVPEIDWGAELVRVLDERAVPRGPPPCNPAAEHRRALERLATSLLRADRRRKTAR